MNYYDEILEKIHALLANGKNMQALLILDEELGMPYVPKDFEEKLLELKSSIQFEEGRKSYSDEDLERMLKGSNDEQLIAINELNARNLRNYHDLINDYLSADGFINAKVLLIDSMIAQELNEEYHMVQDGMEYDFIPRYQLRPAESDGFSSAVSYLEDALMKEPSLLKMAKEIVYKELMLMLPINADEEEGLLLADQAIIYLYQALGDEKGLDEYLKSAKRELILGT